jgi:4-hydroxybenzoate polyprenyltransferase
VAGLSCGVGLAVVHHGMVAAGWLVYGSLMSANFYVALYAFFTALCAGLLFSRRAERKTDAELEKLVYKPGQSHESTRASALWWLLACSLLAACGVLNYFWR